MDVTYFRSRIPGPELIIEDIVVNQLSEVFPISDDNVWTAGSLPIGAGIPDLVIVKFKPEVVALAKPGIPSAKVLAFIRAVGIAPLDKISEVTGKPIERIKPVLNYLLEIDAIQKSTDEFSVSPLWLDILPEITTIEVKVSNWQKALFQATRNKVFAHQSFFALPEKVATRIKSKLIHNNSEVGLLSINNDQSVSILIDPQRSEPLVWTYYYDLALLLARRIKET